MWVRIVARHGGWPNVVGVFDKSCPKQRVSKGVYVSGVYSTWLPVAGVSSHADKDSGTNIAFHHNQNHQSLSVSKTVQNQYKII